jgi:hypothetical protein
MGLQRSQASAARVSATFQRLTRVYPDGIAQAIAQPPCIAHVIAAALCGSSTFASSRFARIALRGGACAAAFAGPARTAMGGCMVGGPSGRAGPLPTGLAGPLPGRRDQDRRGDRQRDKHLAATNFPAC